ncbi:helix-turn-helix transcriptional regulator [Porphyrobacter sp. HT-58-2]|uniref:helix-turn-helix transcriptional regulator n=1 Tax=Porphyrobacter sp. HT-58-2 TaxID=2023229 RepID=UPI001559F7C3|nr:helix-turn-helix transcriptional regulator [Porphyrobacter sp. HT-58-2]
MATNVLDFPRFERPTTVNQADNGGAVRSLADIRPAAQHLASKVAQHGLRIMVWHDLASLEQPVDAEGNLLGTEVFGWSEAELVPWQNVDRAMRSPLLRVARVASEPLWIGPDGIHSRSANRLLDQIDLLDLEAFPNPASAIVIPVHMPLGQIGAAILTPVDPSQHDLSANFAANVRALATTVWQFVTGYVSVCRDDRYLPTEGLLTTREIECLSWVAHGKTDYEISIILGCSHAGVRYHVTRACAKLGAVNRAQSVFRAAQLGYLGVPLQPRAHGQRAN